MDRAQLPKSVVITEVVTRDGLQDEPNVVPTSEKLRIIEAVVEAGIRSVEVTSFVHPKVVPQMADASELMQSLPRKEGVVYSALVPNLKGAERAIAAGIDELRVVISASESHNRANLNRSIAESLEGLQEVCDFARNQPAPPRLAAGVATSFACPFEGPVPLEQLLRLVTALTGMGVTLVNLADTTGMANPTQVSSTVSSVMESNPDLDVGLHLHDTRGMGLANALAGLDVGVDRFDSSLGGLGGCPFAPGATGNISTEDLVHMLHEMGVSTGVDLEALLKDSRALKDTVGHDLESHVLRAGPSSDLHSFDDSKIARSRPTGSRA